MSESRSHSGIPSLETWRIACDVDPDRRRTMRREAVPRLAIIAGGLLALGAPDVGHADIHHVPLGGDIQAAIDQAAPGDIVQLEAGEYEAGLIHLRGDVAVQGASADKNGRWSEPRTKLEGRFDCPNWGPTILRDLWVASPDGTCLLGSDTDGGEVQRCWFTDSRGAVSVIKGTWLFVDCVIARNGPGNNIPGAGSCGAVGLHIGGYGSATQDVTFTNCLFEDNTSAVAGGAIRSLWGALAIEDCVFRRNVANSRGSAIDLEQNFYPVSISGSLFEHNSCAGDRGAINSGPSLGRVIENCTFRSNYSALGWADISGSIFPAACSFNTCCTVSPGTAVGHGNAWEHPTGPAAHPMCLLCRCDFNCDGSIGPADLGALLGGWDSDDPRYDIDGDGAVGATDLGLMLAQWGDCQ